MAPRPRSPRPRRPARGRTARRLPAASLCFLCTLVASALAASLALHAGVLTA